MAKIDQTYEQIVQKILSRGFRYEDPKRKDVYRLQIPKFDFYHSFEDGFPILSTKKVNFEGVLGEFIAFVRGNTHVKDLTDLGANFWFKDAYNRYKRHVKGELDGIDRSQGYELPSLREFTQAIKSEDFKKLNDVRGELGPIYSAQMRAFGENHIDQLTDLVNELRTNPLGTKRTVTMWNPSDADQQALSCCHWAFEILVEPMSPMEVIEQAKKDGLWQDGSKFYGTMFEPDFNDKLFHEYIDQSKFKKYKFNLQWHQHSVDTFLGLPFNIVYYSLMAELIGAAVNMKPVGIFGNLTNVHIYEEHLDAITTQMNRSTSMFKSPNFKLSNDIPTAFSLNSIVEGITHEDFILEDYQHFPFIKAQMLAYDE